MILHRRNLSCIGCGCSRPPNGTPPLNQPLNPNAAPSRLPSPRFVSTPAAPPDVPLGESPVPHPPHNLAPSHPSSAVRSSSSPSKGQNSAHHPLTPSGRMFSAGGRLRNISSDPLTPCMMFWPENEPLPEQGQIRPNSLLGMPVRTYTAIGSRQYLTCAPCHFRKTQHPPILNTGNRGPIEHQPGDWICRKCNYLNWRRRKVCQTCFPCKSLSHEVLHTYL